VCPAKLVKTPLSSETNSIIADPLFVAPEKYDFRLKPNSPALKFGFKPIDLSKVGVRTKKDRQND